MMHYCPIKSRVSANFALIRVKKTLNVDLVSFLYILFKGCVTNIESVPR
jgi:hypothetical protein